MSFEIKFCGICCTVTFLLAGCMGTSGASNNMLEADDETGEVLTFEERFTEFDNFRDRVEEIPFQDPSTVPTTGSASYTGVIGADIIEPDTTEQIDVILGDLSLEVDFAANTIDGTADNFISDFFGPLGGSLTIATGSGGIDRTTNIDEEYTFLTEMQGQLILNGETETVSADLFGDFVGVDEAHVEGIVEGISRSEEDEVVILDGSFFGDRD